MISFLSKLLGGFFLSGYKRTIAILLTAILPVLPIDEEVKKVILQIAAALGLYGVADAHVVQPALKKLESRKSAFPVE